MSPETQIILGCFGLSLIITYAWWSYLRIWFLRQDLFQTRDELWDAMRVRGTIDLTAHRECRDSINALIRVAPFLSPLTLFRLFSIEVSHEAPNPATMPEEVLVARQKVFRRVCRYILLESLTGWGVTLFLLTYMSYHSVKDWVSGMVQAVFDAPETKALGRSVPEYQVAS